MPHFFSYPSLRGNLASNASRLASFVAVLPADTVHLVGHSLGGLVVLRALMEHGMQGSGRAVLLGSPIRGSMLASSLTGRRGGRFLIGSSLAEWNSSPVQAWLGPTEIGIIAGSFRLGMATFFSRELALPNDGAVAVDETRLPGARHITLPVSHTGLLLSRQVMRETSNFLNSGTFSTSQ